MPSHSHITSACLLHFDSRGRGRVLHYRYFLTAGKGGRVLHYRYFLTAGEGGRVLHYRYFLTAGGGVGCYIIVIF